MSDFNWKNFEAFAFDFDGLLVDSEGSHGEARRLAYAEMAELKQDERFAMIPDEVHANARLHGSNPLTINTWLLQQAGIIAEADPEQSIVQEICTLKHHYYMELVKEGLEVQPGAIDIVRRLMARRPGRLAIVTTASIEEVMPFLQRYKLNRYFPDERIITKETAGVTAPKPAPDAYRIAAERLRVSAPQQILGFEDTAHGAEAGKRAGLKMINVALTRVYEDLKAVTGPFAPDAVTHDFAETRELLGL